MIVCLNMAWVYSVLLVFFLGSLPLLSKFLCTRLKLFKVLGPVVVCYLAGMLAVNLQAPFVLPDVATEITHSVVPIAIILLLLSCDFKSWIGLAGETGLSFLLVIFSVCSSSALGYFFFRDSVAHAHLISGMLTGVFTGGTANMAAVSMALDAPPELFGLLNMYDVVLGGSYLLFTMTLAGPLYGLILPKKNFPHTAEQASYLSGEKVTFRGVVLSVLTAVLILGFSVALSFLFFRKTEASFIIPAITLLAVGASFIPQVKKLSGSFAAGDYFLLVFATGMGLLSDFSQMEAQSWQTGAFMGFVLILSMAIHLLGAALFRLDRDTVIITSVAGIMSPPFVPAVARSLGNSAILFPGVAAGIIGNVAGTLLGIAMARILGM
jgi:uncharacterized membrane protein